MDRGLTGKEIDAALDSWDEEHLHSVHVDRLKSGTYELTLTVSGVKDEHAAYFARQLFILQLLFRSDGTDVETRIGAERNRDGVERIYELIPDEDESR